MSGPYCITCKHFNPFAWQGTAGETVGVCDDPTKIIYYERSGGWKNRPPQVTGEINGCRNHMTLPTQGSRVDPSNPRTVFGPNSASAHLQPKRWVKEQP